MSCAAFVARSFALRTAIHLAHLSSHSYAEHMALDGFYNDIVPLVDKYAEVYTGLVQKIPAYPSITPPQNPPMLLLTDYLIQVRKEIKDDEQESQALLNILAELEELTAQTLYKLKFLK